MKAWLTKRWDDFFFEEIPPQSLAIFRILLGGLLLINEALVAPDLLLWFGTEGILKPETLTRIGIPYAPSLFKLVPDANGWVFLFFGVLVLSTLSMMAGLFTRVSTILVFVCLLSFQVKNPVIVYGAEDVLRFLVFLLIFTRAGAALSLDRRRSGKPAPATIPAWGQRLLQLQLSIIYLGTVYWKFRDPFWRNGSAVCYVLQMPDLYHFPLGSLRGSDAFCMAATWGTLVAELGIGTLMWVRPLRPYVLAVAVAFHLGLEYTLAIPLFQWAMLIPLVTFAPWLPLPNANFRWFRQAALAGGFRAS